MSTYAYDIVGRVSMLDAAQAYGLDPDRNGFCKCPFHGETAGSFKAYSGSGGFHCFGCHAHGNVIDFVEKFFGIGFMDAMKKLNDDFSLGLPIGKKLDRLTAQRAGKQAFLRRKKIREKKRRIADLNEAESRAFDQWKKYDDAIDALSPETPLDDFRPEFIEALKNISAAEYNLTCAESERYEYESTYFNS